MHAHPDPIEIRDGLTTAMTYAVIAAQTDFGTLEKQHGRDTVFWGMLKPPFEAYKIVDVMRTWGVTVFPVNPIDAPRDAIVAGLPCYPSLQAVPAIIDCAVVSVHPRHIDLIIPLLLDAGIQTVWLQYALMKAGLGPLFAKQGFRVVEGCVLMHWDVDHLNGFNKGRHICHIHTILARAARIRTYPDGRLERVPPDNVKTIAFNSETFGAKLIAPRYPDIEVLK
jgi:predicted CoA-binding protein